MSDSINRHRVRVSNVIGDAESTTMATSAIAELIRAGAIEAAKQQQAKEDKKIRDSAPTVDPVLGGELKATYDKFLVQNPGAVKVADEKYSSVAVKQFLGLAGGAGVVGGAGALLWKRHRLIGGVIGAVAGAVGGFMLGDRVWAKDEWAFLRAGATAKVAAK